MSDWNVDAPERSGTNVLIEDGVYSATIDKVEQRVSRFKRDDGSEQERIQVRFAFDESRAKLSMWFSPWYGTTRNGQPSRWKAFIDPLVRSKLIGRSGILEDLIGLTLQVTVGTREKTTANGEVIEENIILAALPPAQAKQRPAAPPPADDVDDLPF